MQIPIIKSRLNKTLPIAFPTAKSLKFPAELNTVTESSGSVVARDTIVAPISISGMPVILLILRAFLTSIFPPKIIKISPIMKKRI